LVGWLIGWLDTAGVVERDHERRVSEVEGKENENWKRLWFKWEWNRVSKMRNENWGQTWRAKKGK
jgi:hypothetical protein